MPARPETDQRRAIGALIGALGWGLLVGLVAAPWSAAPPRAARTASPARTRPPSNGDVQAPRTLEARALHVRSHRTLSVGHVEDLQIPPAAVDAATDPETRERLAATRSALLRELDASPAKARVQSPEWWARKHAEIEVLLLQAQLYVTASHRAGSLRTARNLLRNLVMVVPTMGGEANARRFIALAARAGEAWIWHPPPHPLTR